MFYQRQPDEDTSLWVPCKQSYAPKEHPPIYYSNPSCWVAQSIPTSS